MATSKVWKCTQAMFLTFACRKERRGGGGGGGHKRYMISKIHAADLLQDGWAGQLIMI